MPPLSYPWTNSINLGSNRLPRTGKWVKLSETCISMWSQQVSTNATKWNRSVWRKSETRIPAQPSTRQSTVYASNRESKQFKVCKISVLLFPCEERQMLNSKFKHMATNEHSSRKTETGSSQCSTDLMVLWTAWWWKSTNRNVRQFHTYMTTTDTESMMIRSSCLTARRSRVEQCENLSNTITSDPRLYSSSTNDQTQTDENCADRNE
jgi:hypothetical protein